MGLFVLVVSQSEAEKDLLPAQWQAYDAVHSFRNVKKKLRSEKPSLVVFCVKCPEDEDICKESARYIRQGLANQDTRLVLLRDPQIQLDEPTWMEEHQVNACLVGDAQHGEFNKVVLNREIDTFSYIENNLRQHDAETDMLMCITRFSRSDEKLSDLLKTFSGTLAGLTRASASFQLRRTKQDTWALDHADCEQEAVADAMAKLMVDAESLGFLQQVVSEKSPQINLLTEDAGLTPVIEKIPIKIGSFLSFPITVYDRVLCVLVCLIPDESMECVSMKQINIINKAAEQLTILLERKQAETSLKKQYSRLKTALFELKGAREELAHNEKMASIGRMAAGIAHEINNPLAYVISNITSMDRYLESIMQLQEMQTELLNSIDVQQMGDANRMRQDIFKFEEEADIPFILEDIRAVVSDSVNGLNRVKNIITDLRSFTFSQSAECNVCDLNEVVNDTLKIFRFEGDHNVQINTSIDITSEFKSHEGLLGQVLTNLVKNAIQAMTSADVANPVIDIAASETNEGVKITVRDNGPGIPEEVMNKIFDPFFTTKKVGEGTGLGLSVTFNIVKKLGGVLSCNSQVGEYTEFVMVFSR